MELKVSQLHQKPDLTLIELKGVLDVLGSREIERQVFSIIKEGRNRLIFDLSKLDYINSSGIYCLMECFAKTKENGGYVKLVSASGRVKEILDLVGITKVIPLFGAIDDILEKT